KKKKKIHTVSLQRSETEYRKNENPTKRDLRRSVSEHNKLQDHEKKQPEQEQQMQLQVYPPSPKSISITSSRMTRFIEKIFGNRSTAPVHLTASAITPKPSSKNMPRHGTEVRADTVNEEKRLARLKALKGGSGCQQKCAYVYSSKGNKDQQDEQDKKIDEKEEEEEEYLPGYYNIYTLSFIIISLPPQPTYDAYNDTIDQKELVEMKQQPGPAAETELPAIRGTLLNQEPRTKKEPEQKIPEEIKTESQLETANKQHDSLRLLPTSTQNPDSPAPSSPLKALNGLNAASIGQSIGVHLVPQRGKRSHSDPDLRSANIIWKELVTAVQVATHAPKGLPQQPNATTGS
ncbi:hypothetical protein RFI_13464, partial [Reticulomyxa filosa]